MGKVKKQYACMSCGSMSSKWLGQCPDCMEWGTIAEEMSSASKIMVPKTGNPQEVHSLADKSEQTMRTKTPIEELNRVLGGGLVSGSAILIGGDPGIGKSTLLLQFALSSKSKKILYISGEESAKQIKMRAERINKNSDNCYILCETSTQNIFQQIEQLQPDILVVDSIQTLHTAHIESSPGSVSQIRECTAELIKYAKDTGTAVILIGHINKDGAIAGPKILEHMV